MSKKNQNQEPEVTETSLVVQEWEDAAQYLEGLVQTYKSQTIADPFDEEEVGVFDRHRLEAKRLKVNVENKRKELTQPHLDAQRELKAQADTYLQPLKAIEDHFAAEVNRAKAVVAEREEAKYLARKAVLLKYCRQVAGVFMRGDSENNISCSEAELRAMADAEYDDFVKSVMLFRWKTLTLDWRKEDRDKVPADELGEIKTIRCLVYSGEPGISGLINDIEVVVEDMGPRPPVRSGVKEFDFKLALDSYRNFVDAPADDLGELANYLARSFDKAAIIQLTACPPGLVLESSMYPDVVFDIFEVIEEQEPIPNQPEPATDLATIEEVKAAGRVTQLPDAEISRGFDHHPGEIAYSAYYARADGKSLATGKRLPKWDKLSEDIRVCWGVAALEVLKAAVASGDAAAYYRRYSGINLGVMP